MRHPLKTAIAKPQSGNGALAAHFLAQQVPSLPSARASCKLQKLILHMLLEAPESLKKLHQGRFHQQQLLVASSTVATAGRLGNQGVNAERTGT